ncbi:MAG: DUF58 domain-containing protein [Ichthyobacteriaceae bacterium]|nr:DUF58 domain-containing protein [Ichthyobacteriaceae bacterium]
MLNEEILKKINLEISARRIVEGTISGLHKSPFHGFSTEFAERRQYNNGESTRFLDWKYFAKTEKKYIKKYEEETNLRCHIILDTSSSMFFPNPISADLEKSKIGYGTLLASVFMHIIRKQRDAVGLSMISDTIEFNSQEKTNYSHYQKLLSVLDSNLTSKRVNSKSNIIDNLNQLADKFHRRSFIIVISDFSDNSMDADKLFDAIKHLSYKKHEVVLFNITDKLKEVDLNYTDSVIKFIDLESNESVLWTKGQGIDDYRNMVMSQSELLRKKSLQYKFDYQQLDINKGFEGAIFSYLKKRSTFF